MKGLVKRHKPPPSELTPKLHYFLRLITEGGGASLTSPSPCPSFKGFQEVPQSEHLPDEYVPVYLPSQYLQIYLSFIYSSHTAFHLVNS